MFVQLKPIWDVNVRLAGQVFLYGSSLLARNVVLWCIPPHYSIFKNFFFYDYHSFDKKKWLELEAGEYVGWSLWLYARCFLEGCFNRLALSCAFLLQPYREPDAVFIDHMTFSISKSIKYHFIYHSDASDASRRQPSGSPSPSVPLVVDLCSNLYDLIPKTRGILLCRTSSLLGSVQAAVRNPPQQTQCSH